jgi:hypothetical protein
MAQLRLANIHVKMQVRVEVSATESILLTEGKKTLSKHVYLEMLIVLSYDSLLKTFCLLLERSW